MKKVDILKKIEKSGIIAVVRGDGKDEGEKICKALILGGIKGIEITFTLPKADELIYELSQNIQDEEVIIGAGTVLDAITARLAILSGAQFIVSPSFDSETAKICNLYNIPYLPGCMSINEITKALEYGVDIIKLFPSTQFSPNIISAIHAPLPYVNIMPTGGVDLSNMQEWFNSGAIAVGVGGKLISPAKENNYEQITSYAKQYVEKLNEIRK